MGQASMDLTRLIGSRMSFVQDSWICLYVRSLFMILALYHPSLPRYGSGVS